MLKKHDLARFINQHFPINWVAEDIQHFGRGDEELGMRVVASRILAGKYRQEELEAEQIRAAGRDTPALGFFTFRDQKFERLK